MQTSEQAIGFSLQVSFISHAKFFHIIYSDFPTAILPRAILSQTVVSAKLRNTAILWSQKKVENKLILPLQNFYKQEELQSRRFSHYFPFPGLKMNIIWSPPEMLNYVSTFSDFLL